jgi:hypothetical protein
MGNAHHDPYKPVGSAHSKGCVMWEFLNTEAGIRFA